MCPALCLVGKSRKTEAQAMPLKAPRLELGKKNVKSGFRHGVLRVVPHRPGYQ